MIELIQPMMIIAVMATLPVLLRWVGHFEVGVVSCVVFMSILMLVLTFLFSFENLDGVLSGRDRNGGREV